MAVSAAVDMRQMGEFPFQIFFDCAVKGNVEFCIRVWSFSQSFSIFFELRPRLIEHFVHESSCASRKLTIIGISETFRVENHLHSRRCVLPLHVQIYFSQ